MPKKLRIVQLGLGELGAQCLHSLIDSGNTPALVLLAPNHDTKTMQQLCQAHSVTWEYAATKSSELYQQVATHRPDLLVITSFPHLIKPNLIALPSIAAINVHTSYLPYNRGVHPLNWCLIRDDPFTGVTIHYIDQGMDSGDVIDQVKIPIAHTDDITTLRDKTVTRGATLLAQVVARFAQTRAVLPATPQHHDQATYAPKRNPSQGKLDWQATSRAIFNQIRALKDPYPNAFCTNQAGDKIAITDSYIDAQPGTVLAKVLDHYLVSTGDGVILIQTTHQLTIGERLY